MPYGDHRALVPTGLLVELGDLRPRYPTGSLAFCVASVTWVALAVLVLLGLWLRRETGSPTALMQVAIVAQSPLVLEAVWYYLGQQLVGGGLCPGGGPGNMDYVGGRAVRCSSSGSAVPWGRPVQHWEFWPRSFGRDSNRELHAD